jgi:hypothetical protein
MWDIKNYYKDDGEPIKCIFCDCEQFTTVIKDKMGYIVMEYELHCANCDDIASYWATGYHDPVYMKYAHNHIDKLNSLLIEPNII